MLQPLCRRTWAPRGQTPIQYAWDRHDRLSVIGALSLAPWAARVGMYFELFDRNIRAEDVVAFIKELRRHLRRRIVLVWDRWSVHRKAARLLREAKCDWIHFEWLPAYAPDLDPVEWIWNHTKYSHLANFVPDDVQHLQQAVLDSLHHQRHDSYLKQSFFRAAKLPI
jgi:transposase